MATPKAKSPARCTHRSLGERGAFTLPILADHNPGGQIRKSRSGKRRAIVLAAVQLLIVAHVVSWAAGCFGGRTTTPIEPSESMEFSKYGVVNAGLIFFSIALLSTLILGRWFCGWGCHIVMLQDLCGWIMRKCGVRPKAFRSRFLIYVPLILALYMFVWPVVYRWGVHWGLGADPAHVRAWQFSAHLTTSEFWKTFPGLAVAIPFLLICGFATVYFLGSKGFCTYGCPYGGFFAPLDKLAPARILVTDACEHCGHCTAVCTSNVRVHEEVREYGMVVDPGCMKCLDCVSVCPNDALYFGFAKPAMMKGPAKNAAPKRVYDLTWREEFAAALVFLLTFFSVRGVYDAVPMLMAAGVGGIVTFLMWKLWRLYRDANVTLYRFQLKLKGSITRAGWVFGAIVVLTALLTIHSGLINAAHTTAGWYDNQVTIPPQIVFSGDNYAIPPEMDRSADRAIALYTLASSARDGGIGLSRAWQTAIDIRLAWLHAAKLEFDQAERILRRNLQRNGDTESICSALALILRGSVKHDEAAELYLRVLTKNHDYTRMLDDFANWIYGDPEEVMTICRIRLERNPRDLHALRWLSIMLMQTGEVEQSVAVARQTIELDPTSPRAYQFLASGLMAMGQAQEAEEALRKALALAPEDAPLNSMMAELLEATDRYNEAQPYRQKVAEIQQRAGSGARPQGH
ncbi:MAG: tetratricopeptide repeat protein [Phycisphaerales bacterium]|nr:tetratricopeptide repeat protein [Phycisphaerales bacterium]